MYIPPFSEEEYKGELTMYTSTIGRLKKYEMRQKIKDIEINLTNLKWYQIFKKSSLKKSLKFWKKELNN